MENSLKHNHAAEGEMHGVNDVMAKRRKVQNGPMQPGEKHNLLMMDIRRTQ